jgi:hypothetical protein
MLPTCEFCKKEYDVKEVKRVYGETPAIHHCCSAQCYTKKLKQDSENLESVYSDPNNQPTPAYMKSLKNVQHRAVGGL